MGENHKKERTMTAMKKKATGLILLALTAALATGCANNTAGSTEATESAAGSTEQQTAGAEPYEDKIVYNPADYVTLGDYKGMEVTVEGNFDVTDEDIKNEVELELSMMGPDYRVPNREIVKEGDQVNLDYVGKIDGEAFDGGTAEGRDIIIGSGTLIKGFEDGLIGKKVGDVVDLNLTFPEEYANADLAGKDVVFTVTINSLKEPVEMTYDTLTDDYIQSKVGMDSVDAYLKEVRAAMEEEAQSAKEQMVSYSVLDKLREVCKVSEHPAGLDEERIEQSLRYYQDMASAQGTDLDTMLSYYGMTEDGLRADLEESTPASVDAEMILMAIADKEGITNDEAAFADYISDVLAQGIYASEEELYKEFTKDYVHRQYCLDKARELVEDSAVVKFVKETDTEKETETETETETESEKE